MYPISHLNLFIVPSWVVQRPLLRGLQHKSLMIMELGVKVCTLVRLNTTLVSLNITLVSLIDA